MFLVPLSFSKYENGDNIASVSVVQYELVLFTSLLWDSSDNNYATNGTNVPLKGQIMLHSFQFNVSKFHPT